MPQTRKFDGKLYYLADAGTKGWMTELAHGFREIGVNARVVPDDAVQGDYRLYISKPPSQFRGKGGAPPWNVNPWKTWKKVR